MDHPASRLLSTASLAYGVYAAVRPRHLGRAMNAAPGSAETWDKVAYGYALRDVPISLTAILGPAAAVETAMKARIASDLADALSLGVVARDGGTRGRILGITLGWAALNAAALAWDRRH